MQKILILTMVFSLISCASNINTRNYTPPYNKPLVDVTLVALDSYRNTDRVTFSIVTRKSCDEKADIVQLGEVGSKGFFGEDSTNKINKILQANQPLNLLVANVSESSFMVTRCSFIKSVTFDFGKKYEIVVHNWSTKDSEYGGFGCDYSIYEVDDRGIEISKIQTDKPGLPDCKISEVKGSEWF